MQLFWFKYLSSAAQTRYLGAAQARYFGAMSPKAPREIQPAHLTNDDAFRAIFDSYKPELLRSVHEEKTLAFEYKHDKGSDKDAMYKYRDVVRHFCKVNPTGVWNWTTIFQAVTSWDRKIGHALSKNPKHGKNAVRLAASNLQQLLQDARNVKRNLKNGARTPSWLMEVVENLQQRPEKTESSDGHSDQPSEESRVGLECPGAPLKKKRTLQFQISSSCDEEAARHATIPLLALKDDPNMGKGIEDITYDWDDPSNKGKRMLPGAVRWQVCDSMLKDWQSGFMKCIWKGDGVEDDDLWISEMTIQEYESMEGDMEVKKKPAGAMKKPAAAKAASMKRPAAAQEDPKCRKKKMDPKCRKREYSNVYHKVLHSSLDAGYSEANSKARARTAASKHIQQLILKL